LTKWSIDSLLPLTVSQQRVVDVAAEVFFNKGQWPVFQCVEATLGAARLDAKAVLGSLPVSPGAVRYGAFRRLDTISCSNTAGTAAGWTPLARGAWN
jgi:hypothetical protein